jgi:hypothetical protein
MTSAEIVTALVRHGTRIAVEGERVLLVFHGCRPPDDLIRAAREAKAALREIIAAPSPKPAGAPDIAPLPEHVAKGLARLQVSPPLWDVSHERWAEIIATANKGALRWHNQAQLLGWRDIDLYGLHPVAPRARHDARGLFFCLGPADRITAITAASATIGRMSGSALRFYRRADDTGAVLAWSVGGTRR